MHSFKYGFALAAVFMISAADGHVRVQPAQSQLDGRQTYTVRVPTEGDAATTSVELEVPAGVSIISIAGSAKTKKTGDRIESILWAVEIPPGESRDFTFEAMNPASGQELIWRAHQTFADGTKSDWVETPKGQRPAPVTKLGTAKP